MKIKRIITAALCCLLLTGCSDMSLTGNDILSPPENVGPQSVMQDLIRDSVGSAYTPVHPASGAYRNAVVTHDVDGDGTDETIALCRTKSGITHIVILYSDGSDYACRGKATVRSTEIERLDFADPDADGREEIILSYPDSAAGMYSLTVIRVDDEVTQSDMTACCSTYRIEDFDGDGTSDILLLSLSDNLGAASAKLLAYTGGALSVRASCETDSRLIRYDAVTCGAVSEGVSGVFVDGSNSSGELTTQVIYYDRAAASLLNPLFLYTGYESTRRTERIYSGDIDGDGLIELPVISPCDSGEKEPRDTVCSRLTWNNCSAADMALLSKRTAILCEDQGYLFNISPARVGSVTARYTDADTVALYVWEFRAGEMRCTDRLLTIRRCAKDAYDPSADDAAVLGETDAAVYLCEVGETKSGLGYTVEEARECFDPIERDTNSE